MLLFQLAKYAIRRISKPNWVFTKESVVEPQIIEWDKVEYLPSVSIIVPTRDKLDLLRKCIDSIRVNSKYENFEIVIVDNGSIEKATKNYLKAVAKEGIRVLEFPERFNFSRICNFAASNVKNDFLCFLNNDAEVVGLSWLEDLVASALNENLFVTGPIILSDADTIQEIGVGLGVSGIAGQIHSRMAVDSEEVQKALESDHFVSVVSFACALIDRKKYWQLGGLDENFAVGLNDVDFCYRAVQKGYKNKIVSSSRIIHTGYGSRPNMATVKGSFAAIREVALFLRKHKKFEFYDRYVATE